MNCVIGNEVRNQYSLLQCHGPKRASAAGEAVMMCPCEQRRGKPAAIVLEGHMTNLKGRDLCNMQVQHIGLLS